MWTGQGGGNTEGESPRSRRERGSGDRRSSTGLGRFGQQVGGVSPSSEGRDIDALIGRGGRPRRWRQTSGRMDYEGGGDAGLDAGPEDLFFLKAVGGVRFMSDVYFSFSLCFPCFIFLSAVLPLLFIFFFSSSFCTLLYFPLIPSPLYSFLLPFSLFCFFSPLFSLIHFIILSYVIPVCITKKSLREQNHFLPMNRSHEQSFH